MSDPTTKPQLEALLRSGVAAARAGNRRTARDLFLAVSRVYPADVRVWLGLAEVAIDAAERRHALEQVLALDPHQHQARQLLAQLVPAPSEALPPPLTPHPDPQAEAVSVAPEPLPPAPPVTHFPLLNRLALLVIAVLILGILAIVVLGRGNIGQSVAALPPQPSPILQSLPSPSSLPTLIPTLTQITTPTRPPLPPTLPAPSPTPPTSLSLGTLVEVDGWSATLLRPDYSLLFDSSIGDLQPSGRFVLVLMAVANNSAAPRPIPPDFFTLVDARGRQFRPIPNASSTYLSLYPRGQYGDLALEESLAAHSGMRSIPIIFDVPRDATGLTLMVHASGNLGWPIEQPTAPSVNVGP
ncbi:hypothetical protein OSCT_0446 [Oscillochloris trichoides DG-6]|uniref:DUF4352 domain-containing protein n=1 Tax=Oscillochloris trichoides DG-6 TaxID=765420 RepID=E1IAU5_9CHLR|nr:hypothetical protein [Oscillochloris trichoides]EFO81701.1 hypothetical protein OSCT_0446 [Oscillochloris trichoides DG-6]